jgi:lipoprotein-releasing system ATP-binding protein
MNSELPATDPQNQAESPLLEARQVRKTYTMGKRALEVLKGVDLTVQRGEFLALQGASGAGKSTLLHLLGGIDHVTAGEVHLGGQRLSSSSASERARIRSRKVGFIFQAYHLLSELNATENVCLPARLARMPIREAEARARALLQRVGLGERLEHRPYELSGGEQQRVAIARALINSPELILADEPTGNLDSETGSEIIELLCALRLEKQTTLIVATHDMQVARRAPRVVRLRDGRIADEAEKPPA